MPPRKAVKRSGDPSGFVDKIRREVEESLATENALLGAFRTLCSSKLTLDSLRLPPKVIKAFLRANYEEELLSFVSSNLAELSALQELLHAATIAKLTGLSVEEVSHSG